MLPKSRKFAINKSFKLKRESCLHKKNQYFNLQAIDLKEAKLSQFAVVVSKKVCKSAVKRNQIKRRLYEAIGNNLNNIKEGFVVLVYVKKEIIKATFSEINNNLKNILISLNILNE